MNSYAVEILRVLLEKDGLRNSEIRDQVWGRLKNQRALSKGTVTVILTRTLQNLVDQNFLEKRVLGHKNVRYFFKNGRAKEKARLLVSTQTEELKRALLNLVKGEKGVIEIMPYFPLLSLMGLTHHLVRAVEEARLEDFKFYKERVMELLNAFYEALQELLKDKSLREELLELVDFGEEDDFGKFLLDLTSLEGLVKLFRRKFESTILRE